jgi:hypothetical protein
VRQAPGFIAALAALLLAAVAMPSATRAVSPKTELALRYAPVVRLVRQTQPCGHGEPYTPTNVSLVLGNPHVALRGPWGGADLVKVAPTGCDLAIGLWGYHLDFPGDALNPGCDYEQWSRRLNRNHSPVTYTRVAIDSSHPG